MPASGLVEITDRVMLRAADELDCSLCKGGVEALGGVRRGDYSLICQSCAVQLGWLTPEQEAAWQIEYQKLHARRGARNAILSDRGANILAVLAPPRIVMGNILLDFHSNRTGNTTIFWSASFDDFVVGHAHRAWFNFLPPQDALAILAGFRIGPQFES